MERNEDERPDGKPGSRVRATLSAVLCTLLFACEPAVSPPIGVVGHPADLPAHSAGRWIEPRLTRDQAHGECHDDTSGGNAKAMLREPDCRPPGWEERHKPLARGSLLVEAAPDVGHGRAVEALILGVGSGSDRQAAWDKGVKEAVRVLEEIVRQRPDAAAPLSDLAAAYLVRGQRLDRPSDLMRALEMAERAVAKDPKLPAAVFNLALLREKLGLRRPALRAWEEYLLLDGTSPWAEEARQHRQCLETPRRTWEEARTALSADRLSEDNARDLVDGYRSEARRWVQDEVLFQWAEAYGTPAAEKHLRTARLVADALQELNGDRGLADAVQVIVDASPSRCKMLAEGHRAFGNAGNAVGQVTADYQKIELVYRDAKRSLEEAESPFAGWAAAEIAISQFHQRKLDEALATLQGIRRRYTGSDHHSLLARTAWLTGLSQIFQGRPLDALNSYETSLETFNRLGEKQRAVGAHVRLAETYAKLGAQREGWRHRYRALQGQDLLQEAQRGNFLSEMSIAVLQLDLPVAALTIQTEAVEILRSLGEPSLFYLLQLRAEVRLYLELREEAQADLREAFWLAEAVQDSNVRENALMRILKTEGKSHRDPAEAIQAYDRALEHLPEEGFGAFRAELLLLRAQAAESTGRSDAARDDLVESLSILEREWEDVLSHRQRGDNENLWGDYFDRSQEAFDLMIRHLVETGDDDYALSYAERSRGRDLLGLIADSGAPGMESFQPLTAEEIRARVPEGRLLLEYVLLDDRLLIWVIRRGKIELVERDAGRGKVDELVEPLRRYSQFDRSGSVNNALKDLYNLLVGGLVEDLGEEEEIVFLPDEALHEVPFAALKHPGSGKFLVEDHVLSVSPSATFHLFALERRETLKQRQERPAVLAVGDPAFAARDVPRKLSRLPGAAREATRVAAFYGDRLVLLEEQATKARFLADVGNYTVIHFAGHAIPSVRNPLGSALVLAADGGKDSVLYAEEWLPLDLSRTRLVVFSACSTAGGHPIGSLATAGLVRPVLGAGVPAVLGTLWDVNSPAAEKLLVRFHDHLTHGKEASVALREAQLEVLHAEGGNRRAIESWAPFQLIGTASLSGD